LSRNVYPYEPTWLDKEFKKSFEKLDKKAKARAEQELGDLLSALKECRHPTMDPALAPWKPSAYSGLGIDGLYEYRLGKRGRVIARCIDPRPTGDVLLVSATIAHDHARMTRLIQTHKAGIAGATAVSPSSDEQNQDGHR